MGKILRFLLKWQKKKYIYQNRQNAFKTQKYHMFEHVNVRITMLYSKSYI